MRRCSPAPCLKDVERLHRSLRDWHGSLLQHRVRVCEVPYQIRVRNAFQASFRIARRPPVMRCRTRFAVNPETQPLPVCTHDTCFWWQWHVRDWLDAANLREMRQHRVRVFVGRSLVGSVIVRTGSGTLTWSGEGSSHARATRSNTTCDKLDCVICTCSRRLAAWPARANAIGSRRSRLQVLPGVAENRRGGVQRAVRAAGAMPWRRLALARHGVRIPRWFEMCMHEPLR